MQKATTPKAGQTKTAAQVREEFNRVGKPVTEWARAHGFTPSLVYAVLEGRAKGRRGKSHQIAVLLGLKAGIAPVRVHGGRKG